MSNLPRARLLFFFFNFIYIFLEREEEREKERERNITVWLPLTPPTGDLACNPGCALTGNRTSNSLIHRLAFNPLSHTSQGQDAIF